MIIEIFVRLPVMAAFFCVGPEMEGRDEKENNEPPWESP
jgi:hypothetical protein